MECPNCSCLGGWANGVGSDIPIPPHVAEHFRDFVQGMANRLFLGYLKYEGKAHWHHRNPQGVALKPTGTTETENT